MSARLVSRLVPLRYAKLPFNSQFGMGGSNHPEANCTKYEVQMRRDPSLRPSLRPVLHSCHKSNPGMYYC